ncbi:erythromycin esterase family protein [Flavobacteriaceae bacterium]|nr:erythromycin esterase family protein [Flavobacteriaceae bacterium]
MNLRIYISVITFFILFQTYAQNHKVVKWINENAIKIEDANPDTDITIFDNSIPKKFADAKLFGFGEATHQGKEFFDIKAKFFKYLVKNQGVNVFIMEDSYPSEAGINEWISGGKGNAETIAKNFSIGFWYCKEVVDLLEWMRNYNLNKPQEEQIRFYGMDIQNVKDINKEIRDLVKKFEIPVSEELLLVADKCAEKKVAYNKPTDWADIQIPKLNEIKIILIDFKSKIKNQENIEEVISGIRALNYLSKYTYYIQNNYSQDRDLKMFENVKWIVENKSNNGKAFIWAHSEHINNKKAGNYSRRNIYNLGRHLKEYYKDDYYSVGFDFGKGTQAGYFSTKDEKPSWKKVEIKEPFAKTYAETLNLAKDEIYFIDMSKALDGNSSNFFKKKSKQIVAGGGGFNPKKDNLYNKKFSEMYDGLIFIKNISLPTNNLIAK